MGVVQDGKDGPSCMRILENLSALLYSVEDGYPNDPPEVRTKEDDRKSDQLRLFE